jgi:endo-alpha-1,4-polygalactosaminidase (GH114 family)
MRERFSHDDELAAYIEQEVRAKSGGKLVVIPGYAHAALPGGIADRLEQRLGVKAVVVAVFRDDREDKEFHNFLWQQSRLLSIDLSRAPHFYYTIAAGSLRNDEAPGRYAALDGARERATPSICYQIAHKD